MQFLKKGNFILATLCIHIISLHNIILFVQMHPFHALTLSHCCKFLVAEKLFHCIKISLHTGNNVTLLYNPLSL